MLTYDSSIKYFVVKLRLRILAYLILYLFILESLT
jgi:hypothetical protein